MCSAVEDLEIAAENKRAKVRFNYSYQALIKSGITLLAVRGFRIKSRIGHHIKILQKMSEILKDESINEIGNAMRLKRNVDFYGAGMFVSDSESRHYYSFVEKIVHKIEKMISKKPAE
jgi:hypothetical protein